MHKATYELRSGDKHRQGQQSTVIEVIVDMNAEAEPRTFIDPEDLPQVAEVVQWGLSFGDHPVDYPEPDELIDLVVDIVRSDYHPLPSQRRDYAAAAHDRTDGSVEWQLAAEKAL